jgi:hypothetical protein
MRKFPRVDIVHSLHELQEYPVLDLESVRAVYYSFNSCFDSVSANTQVADRFNATPVMAEGFYGKETALSHKKAKLYKSLRSIVDLRSLEHRTLCSPNTFDVFLTIPYGVGLGLARAPSGILVVVSFNTLPNGVISPAEECGMILRGDVLLEVHGHPLEVCVCIVYNTIFVLVIIMVIIVHFVSFYLLIFK